MTKLSFTPLFFWSFILVLISAISTSIFSENIIHDHLAFTTIAFAIIGLIISSAFITVDAVLKVCNP